MNLNSERKYRSSAGVSLDHSLSLLDTKSEIGFDEMIIQIGKVKIQLSLCTVTKKSSYGWHCVVKVKYFFKFYLIENA